MMTCVTILANSMTYIEQLKKMYTVRAEEIRQHIMRLLYTILHKEPSDVEWQKNGLIRRLVNVVHNPTAFIIKYAKDWSIGQNDWAQSLKKKMS